jgi:hypothetical protein
VVVQEVDGCKDPEIIHETINETVPLKTSEASRFVDGALRMKGNVTWDLPKQRRIINQKWTKDFKNQVRLIIAQSKEPEELRLEVHTLVTELLGGPESFELYPVCEPRRLRFSSDDLNEIRSATEEHFSVQELAAASVAIIE